MILLDSDHFSTLLNPRSAVRTRLLERLEQVSEELAVPIVVAEEQLRAWLAEINRVRDLRAQVRSYVRLGKTIEFLGDWWIVQWSERAAEVFQDMRRAQVRVGTLDLKIASIPLSSMARRCCRPISLIFNECLGCKSRIGSIGKSESSTASAS